MKNNSQSAKLPAFQFYPGDWKKDPGVQALNFHDRGVWFEIILLMHESQERGVLLLNHSPMPDEALARLLGLDNQILTTTLTTLLTYGVAHRRETDGALYSRRMVKDENLRQIRIKAGSQGGNPILLNQKSTTQVNQTSTPSSSSSSSSSSSTSNKIPPAPKGELVLPDWVKNDPKVLSSVKEWIEHRKEKRSKLSQRTLDKQLTKFNTAALLIPAIEQSIEKGWAGLFEVFSKPQGGYQKPQDAPRVQPPLVKPAEKTRERSDEEKKRDHKLLLDKFPNLATKI